MDKFENTQYSDQVLINNLNALDAKDSTAGGVKNIKKAKLNLNSHLGKSGNSLLRINKQGDFFSNFFSNFFSQLKNPSEFSFLKVFSTHQENSTNTLKTKLPKPIKEFINTTT
ncbi:hypothetical protein [Chryseobacterium sp. ISL-6]|uniref:hypothetical protein n=1 Tax=Chryseobacterium sp. ISL-6 TaxID=2819143 RepID=UPI002035C489|nr:hypothetical protein [Chryseobacterium sp. ISL-6]